MVANHGRGQNQAGWTKIMFSVYGTWQPRISAAQISMFSIVYLCASSSRLIYRCFRNIVSGRSGVF